MDYSSEGPVAPFAGRADLPARLHTGIVNDLDGVAPTRRTYQLSLLEQHALAFCGVFLRPDNLYWL